ncbi:lysophospholipase [SAR86 cluster bacterium]|jgi:alpha-beta hydrolase superfamily lysophospholipase|nr:lysophospholipase [SAR86 cluster bacterium]
MIELNFKSSIGTLRGACWNKVEKPWGTLQISHGLGEYHKRYRDFAEYLNKQGLIVYCNDHLGHGLHVINGMKKGYFGSDEGFAAVVDQFGEMNAYIRREHLGLKHYVFGHSLGTAVLLSFLKRGVIYEKCILSASFLTSKFLLFLNSLFLWPEQKTLGLTEVSRQMEEFTTKRFNSNFKPNRTTHDWLSSNNKSVDEYVEDDLCGFPNTVKLWMDLKDGFKNLWTKETFKMFDTNNKFLLLTGTEDAVNSKGSQSEKIHNILLEAGHASEHNYFQGMRHEILNETEKKVVYKRIIDFLKTS